jgi:hypothetical protein
MWDFLVAPLVPLSSSKRVLTISPTIMNLKDPQFGKSQFFWSLGSDVDSLKPPIRKLLADHPDLKRVAIFCWNNFWGEAHLRMWRQVLHDEQREVVAQECEGDFSSDLRALTQKLVSLKPDLIIASTNLGAFAKRKAELKSPASVLNTADLVEFVEDPNFPVAILEGQYMTDWKEPEAFSGAYLMKFGQLPLHEASKSYYALQAVVKAAELLQPGESLGDSIRRVKITKPDNTTIDFSLRHPYPNDSVASLRQVRNGRLVDVE